MESSSAPQSEDIKPEETFSHEEQEEQTITTEQEAEKSSTPPLQDPEKVSGHAVV